MTKRPRPAPTRGVRIAALAIMVTIGALIVVAAVVGSRDGGNPPAAATNAADYRTERCSDFLGLPSDEQFRQAFEVLSILRQGDVPQSQVTPSISMANRFLADLRDGCDTSQNLTVGDTAAALVTLDLSYDR